MLLVVVLQYLFNNIFTSVFSTALHSFLIFVYLGIILIVLQVDHNALADNLLQLASNSDIKAFNRKILMNLVKK